MNILSATDKSHGRHSVAVMIHDVLGSLDHALVVAEPEVIVRTKVNDFFAFNRNYCRLGRRNDTLLLVSACCFDIGD